MKAKTRVSRVQNRSNKIAKTILGGAHIYLRSGHGPKPQSARYERTKVAHYTKDMRRLTSKYR